MTMLQTFDLKGNKQSFANWISNLSPCETPFISMIPKEKVDQVQYSWQTDALSAAAVATTSIKEGSVAVATKPSATTVVTNFTQIYRKAVRVSDTTKKVSLYGRSSELSYQMEKAGMEIKRDLESALLTSTNTGRPGTAGAHGIASGVQKLVATLGAIDGDTGAVVHKVVQYGNGAHIPKFTQVQVFDMTYNLYLAGSRANKVMVHPMHMAIFSDWISANIVTPHVHRMFDGMETKFNSHVSSFRDPLGQVFDIIPNRYMPKNQLFFFNEKDWTQMILRAPEKVELAKNGSSEKHMIEMEVGLRHRNPFASGILEFNAAAFKYIAEVVAVPGSIKADNIAESEIQILVKDANGVVKQGETPVVTVVTSNHGSDVDPATVDGAVVASDATGIAKAKVKHTKGARIKVVATTSDASSNFSIMETGEAALDSYESRD